MSTVRSVFMNDDRPGGIPIVYNGDPFGTAAVALSLATNVFSTTLIGYKTWCATRHHSFRAMHAIDSLIDACVGSTGGSSGSISAPVGAAPKSSKSWHCLWSRG